MQISFLAYLILNFFDCVICLILIPTSNDNFGGTQFDHFPSTNIAKTGIATGNDNGLSLQTGEVLVLATVEILIEGIHSDCSCCDPDSSFSYCGHHETSSKIPLSGTDLFEVFIHEVINYLYLLLVDLHDMIASVL